MWRCVALWALVMGAVTTGLISTAAPAFAHATVTTSTPRDGARLDASPPVLSFDLQRTGHSRRGFHSAHRRRREASSLAAPLLESGRQRIVVQLAEKLLTVLISPPRGSCQPIPMSCHCLSGSPSER